MKLNSVIINSAAGALVAGTVLAISLFGGGMSGSGVYAPLIYPASLSYPRPGSQKNWTMTTELSDLMEMETVLAPFLAVRLDASHYTLDQVKVGKAFVPHLFLPRLPTDLKAVEDTETRKSIFLRTILPLVLRTNGEILAERKRLQSVIEEVTTGKLLSATDETWLQSLADKYETAPDDYDKLLRRVDIVPVALALAQAVEESGWGTSRFARDGNAIFGQYTTVDDHGIIPKKAGKSADFKIKAFPDLLSGIRSYMRNLNTHPAYADLRQKRALIRSSGSKPSGRELARTLTGYSERGQDYIKTLHLIIDANDLVKVERNARLEKTNTPAPQPTS